MSTRTERSSVWSPEENVDPLENVDKEIQLVSTSSESNSVSNRAKNSNDSFASENSTPNSKVPSNKEFTVNNSKSCNDFKRSIVKFSSSCDDLIARSVNCDGDHPSGKLCENGDKFNRNNKCDPVPSKVKNYIDNNIEGGQRKFKSTVISTEKKEERERYLEEINKQLTKELDEKNAILSVLQENYERLLFKYAKAQNRIDELRFKCMTENSDSKFALQLKCGKSDSKGSLQPLCDEDHFHKPPPDIKYQRGMQNVSGMFEEPSSKNLKNDSLPVNFRPSSLNLDNNLKCIDRELILSKAATPTDSEGLSSVITSMSGHSKILNCLNEENQINKKSNLLKDTTSNFILGENSTVNDSFDKVKNWQNSLPPLEQIETPETTLYNVFSNNAGVCSSGRTKYKEISLAKNESQYIYTDESCPTSWREEQEEYCESKNNSHRALSLPNNLIKNDVLGQMHDYKGCHSVDMGMVGCSGGLMTEEDCNVNTKECKSDAIITSTGQIRSKRPLLRCSSLPDHQYDIIKPENCKNEIYIPPLDLANLTLSDDESYYQQDLYPVKEATSKRNGGSMQTAPIDFNSGKSSIGEQNFISRILKQKATSKVISVTTEKSNLSDSFFKSKSNRSKMNDDAKNKRPSSCKPDCMECGCGGESRKLCHICGESISEKRKNDGLSSFGNRSNSFESIRGSKNERGSRIRSFYKQTTPFKRSISFNSEEAGSNKRLHDERVSKNLFLIQSQESFENFELFATNLKSRSQAVMKALTAHINNS